jgi:hypothetical protein
MALVTTLMTSPLLGVIYRESRTGVEVPASVLEKRIG